LVAALDDPSAPDNPWLLVLEFQAQVDPDKVDVTLEEVAVLRCRARHGPNRQSKYKVTAELIYLLGIAPMERLDMTLPDGSGTWHAPLVWNVGSNVAVDTLEAVANGRAPSGLLFWIALMAGGGGEPVIRRWREVVAAAIPDRRARGNLAGIALVFADLAGCRGEWKRGLEGFEMTESQVVNEWIHQGEAKGRVEAARQFVLDVLEVRFPRLAPEDVKQLIRQQDSLEVLQDWHREALQAFTLEQFLAVLRR
jgi:hypothetical protein